VLKGGFAAQLGVYAMRGRTWTQEIVSKRLATGALGDLFIVFTSRFWGRGREFQKKLLFYHDRRAKGRVEKVLHAM